MFVVYQRSALQVRQIVYFLYFYARFKPRTAINITPRKIVLMTKFGIKYGGYIADALFYFSSWKLRRFTGNFEK
jgi:hypothetical protein